MRKYYSSVSKPLILQNPLIISIFLSSQRTQLERTVHYTCTHQTNFDRRWYSIDDQSPCVWMSLFLNDYQGDRDFAPLASRNWKQRWRWWLEKTTPTDRFDLFQNWIDGFVSSERKKPHRCQALNFFQTTMFSKRINSPPSLTISYSIL